MNIFRNNIVKIVICVFALIGFVFTIVFVGMQLGIFNVRGSNTSRNASLAIPAVVPVEDCVDKEGNVCAWDKTLEWDVLQNAFLKDQVVIRQVSEEVGISPRMLVATISPEQIRFFTSNRETFKRYFEPLKILASLSKFSLGISGIKEDTAKQIEAYTNDEKSPFYPGASAKDLIAYTSGVNHDTELYDRLTDEHNHYYSYLYTALFIKEIENQWARAGFDISQKPEVVATLFNIGFNESLPKSNPVVAGSSITLAGHTYLYGELGALVYNGDELDAVFPH